MKYSVFIQYDETDNIYIASVPELKGCMAHGRTPSEALKEVSVVCELWLESAREIGKEIPEPSLFSGVEAMAKR